MQIVAIVVSLAFSAVGLTLFTRMITHIVRTIRVGQPAPGRLDNPGSRAVVLAKEMLLHTRMLQWTKVGVAHWVIMVGFGLLFATLVNAYGQLFDAHFILPVIGHFPPFEWLTEAFAVTMIWAIVPFMVYRATRPKDRVRGESGRLYGSKMWQGYFVEWVILTVGLCILALRFFEYALADEKYQSALHFPFTFFVGELFVDVSPGTLENLIWLVAMLKIAISMTWMIVLGRNATMGVAWHRFTAPFNVFLKRDADGRTALGAMKPLTSNGKALTLDDIDDLDEDATLGVGSVEDFSWKGLLDFTTCTECGRCQSQCPAWNTDKPLSPKLLITNLRNHAYAKAPYLQASEDARPALLEGNTALATEVERPLVGDTEGWAWMPEGGAVIDTDVLWSCTSCGACVQQCPVDIEHVDHIMDMRRYQVLVESNFPAELNQLFKGLENKGNPWNMSPNARLDWAKGLDFEVKVVGETIESLDEVDWLFWVGCAGAYEDRAKKTTRAVAELLDIAGVSFGVLGNGETCTGDPARRAGNEFVFQGLAQQNVEVFKEHKVKKVVSTCAHCFNTLKNEYREFGIELEVVHHTQLLNRLVREGKLTPVKEGAGAAKRTITYHDPCYIGRHNGVYTPPRELLQVLPGAEYAEMERHSERSFCCGAGGARMWMEENLGERINVNRTKEAVATGADQIAVGCPFCRVMLSDGLTAQQAKGEAREEVEVLDVAQMLLASVKGESATKLQPGAGAAAAASDVATKAEPEAGDATQSRDTVTATEDAGPLAKASGGSSLFDTPVEETVADDAAEKSPVTEVEGEPAAEPATDTATAKQSGGSLFDLGGEPEPAAAPAKQEHDLGSSGSLFDVGADQPAEEPAAPAAKTEAAPAAEAKTEAPDQAPELGAGGSLFDLAAPEPAAEPAAAPQPAADEAPAAKPDQAEAPAPSAPSAPSVTSAPSAAPAAEIPEGGSLFDIAAPEPAAPSAPAAEPAAPEDPASSAVEEPEPTTAEPPTTDEAPAAAPVAASPAPATEIPEGGSLFDIAAPEPASAPPAPAQPEPAAAEPEPEPVSSDKAEPAEAAASADPPAAPSGEEVTAAATAAAASAPTAEPDPAAEPSSATDAEPDPVHAEAAEAGEQPVEPAAEAPAEEKPGPAAGGGEAHQPRTDVEIGEGSLFDL
nr:(Fe-S)-binding protein [Nocardioides ferulae]